VTDNSTYHVNTQETGATSSDPNQIPITITDTQMLYGDVENNTFETFPISMMNDPSAELTADKGFSGSDTITLQDITSGADAGMVEATAVGGTGGHETEILQTTPYTTADGSGTIYYAPSQPSVDTVNGTAINTGTTDATYVEFSSNTYSEANEPATTQALTSNTVVTPTSDTAPCFTAGTFIRTPSGDVVVEQLKAGDMVVTASGQIRPVRWIGNLHVTNLPSQDCARARNLWPVRIAAHAFAANVPDRDLVVSPGHAIAVTVMDEVFTQAIRLVNGATIRQEPRDSVTYWHVELDSHDVLLSNNLPSESYLDVGNRAALGLNVPALRLAASVSDYARPLVEHGPVIDAIRARLVARARDLGWQVSTRSNMHLTVDGRRVEAMMNGDRASFIFPATAQNVHLRSRTFRPAEWESCSDTRTLGLSLSGLHIADGLGHEADIALDHAGLANQFHEGEAADSVAWRWTRGDLHLPQELWADCKGQVTLTLTLQHANGQYWDRAGTGNAAPLAGEAHTPRMRA